MNLKNDQIAWWCWQSWMDNDHDYQGRVAIKPTYFVPSNLIKQSLGKKRSIRRSFQQRRRTPVHSNLCIQRLHGWLQVKQWNMKYVSSGFRLLQGSKEYRTLKIITIIVIIVIISAIILKVASVAWIRVVWHLWDGRSGQCQPSVHPWSRPTADMLK